jgi:hypothetical protein
VPESVGGNKNRDGEGLRPGFLWWIGHLALTAAACFFAWFGVSLLVASYGLDDPFSFIMTFFASNLMILISLTMILGFALRMWRVWRLQR